MWASSSVVVIWEISHLAYMMILMVINLSVSFSSFIHTFAVIHCIRTFK